jgi:hypothetical protein
VMGGGSDDELKVFGWVHVFAPNMRPCANFDHLHFQADPMLSDISAPPK